jgi:hypothetical protein
MHCRTSLQHVFKTIVAIPTQAQAANVLKETTAGLAYMGRIKMYRCGIVLFRTVTTLNR